VTAEAPRAVDLGQIDALRLAYANACEAMGMAHANGSRAEWLAAVDAEIAARSSLLSAVAAVVARAERAERSAKAWEAEALLRETNRAALSRPSVPEPTRSNEEDGRNG
jgi:hypothetical protein